MKRNAKILGQLLYKTFNNTTVKFLVSQIAAIKV